MIQMVIERAIPLAAVGMVKPALHAAMVGYTRMTQMEIRLVRPIAIIGIMKPVNAISVMAVMYIRMIQTKIG